MEEKKTTKPRVAKKESVKTQVPEKQATPLANGKLAILLVRGVINAKEDTIATLDKFMLRQKLACVVVPNNRLNKYAAIKCKDYVAFGEISEETYKELVAKRGEKDSEGNIKKYFRMHPPRGGFERKGIKAPFTKGGALGYRGAKMNELLKKML
jgi:large subunit ribosomal protein L30